MGLVVRLHVGFQGSWRCRLCCPQGPPSPPPRPCQWGGEEDRLAGFDGRCLEVVQSTPAHVCGPRRKGVGHVGFLGAYRKRQGFGELVAFTLLLLGWMR